MQQHLLDRLVRLTSGRSTDREWRIPRFSALYQADGARLQGIPLIKITGTNGKGSVVAMLAACMTAAGSHVGVSTSPHLQRVTERIRIGDEEIDEAGFCGHLDDFEEFLSGFLREKGSRYIPSFFEALLLISLRAFEQANIDFAIFEAGVGGAHDPTSVIPGLLSVLTTVAFDHEAELGDTLSAIATEKVGIADSGSLLILGPAIEGEARAAVERAAAIRGLSIRQARRAQILDWAPALSGSRAQVTFEGRESEVLLPLLGDFQRDNLATVVATAEAIEESGIAIGPSGLAGIAYTRWPARLEYRPGAPSWLLDGAHNEEAMGALASFVSKNFQAHERILVYGTTGRKTYRRYLHLLPRIAQEVVLTDDFDDAEDRVVLAHALEGRIALSFGVDRLDEILSQLRDRPAREGRIVIVAGSLYLVGKARTWLNSQASPMEI